MKPNFVYIGPPKAASTWLAKLLEAHPDVYVTPAKETYFFDRFYDRGTAWYEQHFDGATTESVIAEVCHDYLYSADAALRARGGLGDAKLMVCLREHTDWVRSSCRFAMRNGKHRGDLLDFIEERPEVWGLEYARLLEPWIEHFGRDSVHIALYDELSADSAAFARELWGFLEIEDIDLPESLQQRVNPAMSARNQRVNSVAKDLAKWLRRLGLATMLHKAKHHPVVRRSLFTPVEATADSERDIDALARVRDFYADDRARIRALGVDLSAWPKEDHEPHSSVLDIRVRLDASQIDTGVVRGGGLTT